MAFGFIRAVSQLLRSYKGREEWFSLGENHEWRRGFGLHQLRNRYTAAVIPTPIVISNAPVHVMDKPDLGVDLGPDPVKGHPAAGSALVSGQSQQIRGLEIELRDDTVTKRQGRPNCAGLYPTLT